MYHRSQEKGLLPDLLHGMFQVQACTTTTLVVGTPCNVPPVKPYLCQVLSAYPVYLWQQQCALGGCVLSAWGKQRLQHERLLHIAE